MIAFKSQSNKKLFFASNPNQIIKGSMYKFVFFLSLSIFQVEQITAEYKALALQYHPDKNEGDKDAEAKFQQLKVLLLLL